VGKERRDHWRGLRAHIGAPEGPLGGRSETGFSLTVRCNDLTNGLRLSVPAVVERPGALARLRLVEVPAETSGGLKGAGLGPISGVLRGTAGMDFAGSSEAKGDGVIAGAELMSEDPGNGVTPGVALLVISGGARGGATPRFESEATSGAGKGSAILGARLGEATPISPDLGVVAGAALTDGAATILSGCTIAPLPSRRMTKVINTIAEIAIPVRKAASIRGIRTPTQALRQ
jgi:hypothetical protein